MLTSFQRFITVINHPVKYRFFLLTKLPMAFIAGLKIKLIAEEKAIVKVKYKWLNQNPFRSIYFAVLSMAAELSTGLLSFGHIYKRKPSASMLVIQLQADFYKKAVGNISFVCEDGLAIKAALENAYATGEGQVIECTSTGYNEQQEVVAKFIFTWSFKAKTISK
jgi:hypothetical protein